MEALSRLPVAHRYVKSTYLVRQLALTAASLGTAPASSKVHLDPHKLILKEETLMEPLLPLQVQVHG